ncbi:hypothetical protein LshimejAT787_1403270 [Lyophyllum shimeji]|uniref:Uncharacterized protein n=1 Tax=Lyophyllum shimeji TaxID=47721 RepID=A0A9P3PVP7_LYOSH|nr:hypothetical protein LshimejAT787_1403270 [Lyophyllum shimeji]
MPFNAPASSPIVVDRLQVDFDQQDASMFPTSRVGPAPGKDIVWLPDARYGSPPRPHTIWAPVFEPSDTVYREPPPSPTLDEIDDLISSWTNHDESALSHLYDASPSQTSQDTTPDSSVRSFASTPFSTPPDESWIEISPPDERGDSPISKPHSYSSTPAYPVYGGAADAIDKWPADFDLEFGPSSTLSMSPRDPLLIGSHADYHAGPAFSLLQLSPLLDHSSLPLFSFGDTVDPAFIFPASDDEVRGASTTSSTNRPEHQAVDSTAFASPLALDDPRGLRFSTEDSVNGCFSGVNESSQKVLSPVVAQPAADTPALEQSSGLKGPPLTFPPSPVGTSSVDDVSSSTPPVVSLLLGRDGDPLTPVTEHHPSKEASGRLPKRSRSQHHSRVSTRRTDRNFPSAPVVPTSGPAESGTPEFTPHVLNRGAAEPHATPSSTDRDTPVDLPQRRTTRPRHSMNYEEIDDDPEPPISKRAKPHPTSPTRSRTTGRWPVLIPEGATSSPALVENARSRGNPPIPPHLLRLNGKPKLLNNSRDCIVLFIGYLHV